MRRTKKMAAALLSLIMLAVPLGGCGNGAASTNDNIGNSLGYQNGTNQGENQSAESTAMGRYVEEVTDLSANLGYARNLYELENGNFIIADEVVDFLISTDGGITWETDRRDWKSQMTEDGDSIMSVAVGADNTVAVIYDAKVEDDSEGTEDVEIDQGGGRKL